MGSVKFISYNCQAAAWKNRMYSILLTLSFASVLGLQGTRTRRQRLQTSDSEYRTERVNFYDVVHWHAADEAFSNSSTGVTLAVDRRYLFDLPTLSCSSVLTDLGFKLQLSRCSTLRDHSPVLIQTNAPNVSRRQPINEARWDWNKVCMPRLYEQDIQNSLIPHRAGLQILRLTNRCKGLHLLEISTRRGVSSRRVFDSTLRVSRLRLLIVNTLRPRRLSTGRIKRSKPVVLVKSCFWRPLFVMILHFWMFCVAGILLLIDNTQINTLECIRLTLRSSRLTFTRATRTDECLEPLILPEQICFKGLPAQLCL